MFYTDELKCAKREFIDKTHFSWRKSETPIYRPEFHAVFCLKCGNYDNSLDENIATNSKCSCPTPLTDPMGSCIYLIKGRGKLLLNQGRRILV